LPALAVSHFAQYSLFFEYSVLSAVHQSTLNSFKLDQHEVTVVDHLASLGCCCKSIYFGAKQCHRTILVLAVGVLPWFYTGGNTQ
tara:strand:- start:1639 stop:1893 length:255 start_codon:yes stop_codon:yes gene_type:complete